jgi:hypothetical protein
MQCLASSELLTPTPSPLSECVLPDSSPAPKAGGRGYTTHSPGGEGVGGVNISEDSRHWIGLLQNNPLYAPNHTFSVLWLQNMSGILVLNMNV